MRPRTRIAKYIGIQGVLVIDGLLRKGKCVDETVVFNFAPIFTPVFDIRSSTVGVMASIR